MLSVDIAYQLQKEEEEEEEEAEEVQAVYIKTSTENAHRESNCPAPSGSCCAREEQACSLSVCLAFLTSETIGL